MKSFLSVIRFAALALVAVGLARPARAALLVYDGFEYTGSLIEANPAGGLLGQGGGTGWNGRWLPAGVAIPGFPIAPGSLLPPSSVTPASGNRVRSAPYYAAKRNFLPLTVPRGGSLWFSVRLATSAVENFGCYVEFGREPQASASPHFSNSGNTGQPQRWLGTGPEVVPSAPALLVAEVARDAGAADAIVHRYWVNPGPAMDASGRPLDPPVTTQVGFRGSTDSTYDYVTLVCRSGVNEFDEIRIGTSYTDINSYPPVRIATSASPAEGGTTAGDGTYRNGASVRVDATPHDGYAFVDWTEGGAEVSTSAGYSFNATADRTLVAHFAACPAFSWAPTALPGGAASEPYGPQLVAVTGGTGPYVYTVTSGSLPPGLVLASDGTLSGTPTTGGDFAFTVTATAANGCTGALGYTLHLTCLPLAVTPTTLPEATPSVPYGSQFLATSGGAGPYRYEVTDGSLPPGMSLSPAGEVSGTPSAGGDFHFTVTVTDANGCSDTTRCSLSVACPEIVISPATLPSVSRGAFFATPITASGGTGLFLYVVSSGSLPDGLGLLDGLLSGTASVGGAFNFTVTARDAYGCTASRTYTLLIQSLSIACPSSLAVQCLDDVPPAATDAVAFIAQGGALNSDCGPINLTLALETATDSDCPQVITRTYRVTDACGGLAECEQTITVQDTVAPTISAAPRDLSLECGTPIPDAAPTASDSCDPSPTVVFEGEVRTPDPSCPNAYTLTRSWHARDRCGNPSPTVHQTIKIHDTKPPYAILLPGSLDRVVEAGDSRAIADAYAEIPEFRDDCEGPVTPMEAVVTMVTDGSCATGHAVERRWRAQDRCGNVTDEREAFVQRITFVDTTPPTITCPDTIRRITGPGPVDFAATASDNVDLAPTIVYDHPPRSTFPIGDTVVRCKARDRCGNESAECTFTVTVSAIGCVAGAQEAYVKASDTSAGSQFGDATAVDGNTMVAGAPYERSGADISSGTVYVFERGSDGRWTQQARLKAPNAGAGDEFGYSVALSDNTLVVGAPRESSRWPGVQNVDHATPEQADDGAPASGAAYVFVKSGVNWTLQAYLKASNADELDFFGTAVAISGDTIVVGAPSEDSGSRVVNGNEADNRATGAGAAYVFVREGGLWHQEAYLKAANAEGVRPPLWGDGFGSAVAVSGGIVVVGAPLESSQATGVNGDQDDNSAAASGAAHVFVRDGTTWTQQAYLKASNTDAGDRFGVAVAVSGSTVVVGTPYESSSARGVNPGFAAERDNGFENAGAAYVFKQHGADWSQEAYLKASNTRPAGHFGGNCGFPAIWR